MERKISLRQIVLIGLMSALVLIFSGFRIYIPLPVDHAAIQFGNIMCVLSGLLLGPIGGLASAIGSALYDLFNPAYAPEAWITFLTKFFIGFLTGLIAHWHGRGAARRGWNLAGAAVGSVTYVVLYLGKSLIMGKYVFSLAAGSPMMLYIVPKAATSLVNAVIAVAVAVPLWELVRLPLDRGGLSKTT